MKSYLRRHVEKNDPLDMDAYSEWIKKLYEEWSVPGEVLSNGRVRKKKLYKRISSEVFLLYSHYVVDKKCFEWDF